MQPDYRRGHGSVIYKVYAAVLLLVSVAVGVRIIWWALSPFLPLLIAIVFLGGIYLFIFRRR